MPGRENARCGPASPGYDYLGSPAILVGLIKGTFHTAYSASHYTRKRAHVGKYPKCAGPGNVEGAWLDM